MEVWEHMNKTQTLDYDACVIMMCVEE
jgi:hypothetical protein